MPLSPSSSALRALRPDERPHIVTRSSTFGTGVVAAHWMGDTNSDWPSLRQSIIGMIEMNMFAVTHTGSDICGFNLNTTEELCIRWSQLGAFYPFSRNHNTDDGRAQDPAVWSSSAVDAIRQALLTRYSLLAHLYTLMHAAHVSGSPVVRALFYDAPHDPLALAVDDQFLWGRSLMFAPVVTQGARERSVYFPAGGVWYDYNRGMLRVTNGQTAMNMTVPMDLATFGLFMLGGHVLFRQAPAETSAEVRRQPFELLIALDLRLAAVGSVYWDDGHSRSSPSCRFDVTVGLAKSTARQSLTITINQTVANGGCTDLPPMTKLTLAGCPRALDQLSVNEVVQPTAKFEYDTQAKRAHVNSVNVIMSKHKQTRIALQFVQ